MTEHPDRPGYSFDPGPPPEASRFLKNKGLRPSFGYEDVEPEEHAVAFAVAKIGEIDLLEAAHTELQKALDEGLPLSAFQKSWRNNPKLTEWWGKKEMVDPLTGEFVEARLGSPRRLKTIYRANLASARAAGQWERAERTKAMLPFLEYRLGPSERHRPHHEAKAGMILPVDSPFWDEWMPPNGWGCKCWVRQLTRREAERRGIAATPDIPDMKYRNPRTGTVAIVPQGIDPGWQRNPGKLRLQAVEAMLKDRLEASPEAVQLAALRDIATSWRVERLMTDLKAKGNVPIAILPADYLGVLPDAKRVIEISDVTRVHVAEEKSDRRIADLAHMAALDQAARVVLQKRPGQHPRLIFELDSAMEPEAADPYLRLPLRVYVVIKAAGSFVHSFHRTTNARWRKLRDGDTSTVLKGD
jgi:hypothetical protein